MYSLKPIYEHIRTGVMAVKYFLIEGIPV